MISIYSSGLGESIFKRVSEVVRQRQYPFLNNSDIRIIFHSGGGGGNRSREPRRVCVFFCLAA